MDNGDGLRSTKQLLCSAELPVQLHHYFTCLSVFSIVLSITAFTGNTLILVALHKESCLYAPSKILLGCLAVSDLGVGLITGPLYAAYFNSTLTKRWNMCRFAFASGTLSGFLFSSVSFMTLTAISIERLLALKLGLPYKQVVTLKRAYIAVGVIWVTSISLTAVSWEYLISLRIACTVISFCLMISTYCYINIYLTLRKYWSKAHCYRFLQQSRVVPLNIATYRKSLSGCLWLQLAVFICYLPFTAAAFLVISHGHFSTINLAKMFTITVVYLNSSLNPILCCWKIRRVRIAVTKTIKKKLCLSSSS